MSTFYPQHIQLTHNSASDWSSSNPVLLAGELGIESDTLRIKLGDGVTPWNELLYTDSAIRSRLDELERLTAQYQELADSLHDYFNSLAAKTFREEITD